jgi:hypothetical protein
VRLVFIAAHPAAPALTTVPSRRTPGRTPHAGGLVGALNAEWVRIAAERSPDRADLLRGWADEQPALVEIHGLAAILEAARSHSGDHILGALLLLARGGDQLAARTALQAMLGAAVRLARRTLAHAGGDFEEAVSRAVTALWQVVRDYPVERRSCRPADGISLDVLGLLTGAGRNRLHEVPAGLPTELADTPSADTEEPSDLRDDFWSAARLPAAAGCADEQLVVLLAWGVRSGVVGVADARLLMRLHSPADPATAVSCRDVAEQLGLGHAAVRQRASRATRRLAAAVRDLARTQARPQPARTVTARMPMPRTAMPRTGTARTAA